METLVAKLHALYVRAAGSVDSLQFRIVAAFAVIISLVLASTSYYTQYLAETDTVRFAEEQAAAREERLVGAVRSALAVAPGAPPADPALLPRLLDQAADLYGIDLVVVGPDGRVLGGDARLAPLASDDGADPDGLAVLSVPVASGEIVSVAYRPADAEGVIQEPRASSFVANIQWFLFIAGMTAGAVGLITFIWLSRRILVPLRSLTHAAERLGRGDLSQRVPVPRDVDLGRLGASFNAMAQQLQAAEQERRSMMADIAHELRTPLANIRGYVEAIQDGVIEADHETLATLHDQVGQLGRLIDDLRFVALVDAGALQLDLRPNDVGWLARAAADAIRPRAEAKGVAVETDIAPAPLVDVDRARIAQTLANLLDNAVRHTASGGVVRIAVGAADGAGPPRARVVVSDTGSGIPPDELPLIFERLHRVDPSRARATGGSGLGLTIVKQIVQAHGGDVTVSSVMGEGSVFGVELPGLGAPAAPKAKV